MDHVDKALAQWAEERPDLDVSPMGLIGRLQRLVNALNSELGKTFAKHGLNLASFDVLATLRRAGPPYSLSPGELIESTMVTSGTMTNRIDQLVKTGLVERHPNPADGRGFLIGLSDKGFALIDKAVTDHVETQHRLVNGLSGKERHEMEELLRQFFAGLNNT